MVINILVNFSHSRFSHSRAYLLDIAIHFFCQTKCCGTPVSNGDKLVIVLPPELKPVLARFQAGYPQCHRFSEKGIFYRRARKFMTQAKKPADRPLMLPPRPRVTE